jgi:hypothetical protein
MLPAHSSGEDYAGLCEERLVSLELEPAVDGGKSGWRRNSVLPRERRCEKAARSAAVLEAQVAVGDHGCQQRCVKNGLPRERARAFVLSFSRKSCPHSRMMACSARAQRQ